MYDKRNRERIFKTMNYLQAGKLIRKLRRKNNLSMIEFAKMVGISQPSLSRIENGNQEITFQFLEKACETFNISMSDFFRILEEKSKLQKVHLKKENNVNSEEELDTILANMISTLSFEQKKGLYIFLLPYIKD